MKLQKNCALMIALLTLPMSVAASSRAALQSGNVSSSKNVALQAHSSNVSEADDYNSISFTAQVGLTITNAEGQTLVFNAPGDYSGTMDGSVIFYTRVE